MANKTARVFNDRSGKTHIDQLYVDNLDGTHSLAVSPITVATEIKTSGLSQTIITTLTKSADMTTAAEITPAPGVGKKISAVTVLVSSDTAMSFTIQMETTGNELTKVFLPANGTVPVTLPGYLVGDATNKKLFGKASVAGNVAITTQHFNV